MKFGIKISPNSYKISHLLYANHILLFFDTNIKNVKKFLLEYCNWLGQKINFYKSSILFGKSINVRRCKQISRLLGFKVVEEMEYLGVKIALKWMVNSDFQHLMEKSLNKLNTWEIGLFLLQEDLFW